MVKVQVNASVDLDVWEKIRKKYPESDFKDAQIVRMALLKLVEEEKKKA